MNRISSAVLLLLAVSTAVGAARADSVKERTLALQFVPQEATGTTSPHLKEGLSSSPVDLIFEDGRPSSEIVVVGEGTDDDDHLFPWRSTTPIPEFAKGVVVRLAQGWGIRIEAGADMALVVRLTRFFVRENDQAVGSSYAADVRLAFELKDPDGTVLTSGLSSGDARRYGRKRSADNCNEVLSDALQEASANLLEQPSLQEAWSSMRDRSSTKPRVISPGALLAELIGLKNQGFSTELLTHYVSQQTLSSPLSAQDMVAWKKAGFPETVIQAALVRSPVVK